MIRYWLARVFSWVAIRLDRTTMIQPDIYISSDEGVYRIYLGPDKGGVTIQLSAGGKPIAVGPGMSIVERNEDLVSDEGRPKWYPENSMAPRHLTYSARGIVGLDRPPCEYDHDHILAVNQSFIADKIFCPGCGQLIGSTS